MTALFLLTWWNLCGLALIIVDCPPDQLPDDFYEHFQGPNSLADAVSLIANLPPEFIDNEACIRIYGTEPYNLVNPLVIHIDGTLLHNLTIEGVSFGNGQLPQINGAPVEHPGTNARVFHVLLGSSNKLTIRNLSFSYNGLNNSIISVNQPQGEFEFYDNVVSTYCQAIKAVSYTGQYSFKASIHDNDFTRIINVNPSADMFTIDLSVVNEVLNSATPHNQISITDNVFNNAILPIYINSRSCQTVISNNDFQVGSMFYNSQNGVKANSITINMQDQVQDATASLEFSENTLENVILSVNAVNSVINDNKFIVTSSDALVSGLLLLDNHISYTLSHPYANPMNAAVQNNQFYNKTVVGNQKPCIRLLDDHSGAGRTINLSLVSNSIFSYGQALLIERSTVTDEGNIHQVPQFYNNLISCSSNPISFYVQQGYTAGCVIQIHHSLFENGYPFDTTHFITDTTCIFGDPLIIPDTINHSYSLKWSPSEKSPCIDAGVMEGPFGKLYFVPDIGAIEFDEFENYCATYTFPAHTERNEIKWMSFPVLYNIENGHFTNHLPASEMFSSILNTYVLNEIAWNNVYDYFSDLTIIHHVNQDWTNMDHEVTSPQGYKVVMLPSGVPERTIKVSGFLQPKDTPIQLYGPHDGITVENWVGYFYPSTLNVFDAFEEIIDNLYSIKTQYWSMFRETTQPDSPWIGRSIPGHEQATLSPGDMAIVKCYQDVELIWNNEAPEVPRFKPPRAEHFEFVEKLDYIPIFTDFKGGDIELPKEIAVYIDGVCKGATVVTDSLAQICAYICDDIQYNPEIEFVLYYDTKSQGTMPDYNVWNPETGSYQTQRLDVSTGKDYYLVNITTANADSAPLPRLYITNYPNPFNPRTTIRYYVPENNKVSLRVYNAKGQLVRTLVNEKKAAGLQEVTWSGTDDNGKPCSSGVYFCKLQYKNKNISQKLILMK